MLDDVYFFRYSKNPENFIKGKRADMTDWDFYAVSKMSRKRFYVILLVFTN